MADFEKAKALLQKKQGSTSVYDHLSEVLLKLVTEDPADSVALFEHLSAVVKKSSFPGETTGARAGGKADEGEAKAAALEWSARASSLFAAPEAADGVTPGTFTVSWGPGQRAAGRAGGGGGRLAAAGLSVGRGGGLPWPHWPAGGADTRSPSPHALPPFPRMSCCGVTPRAL